MTMEIPPISNSENPTRKQNLPQRTDEQDNLAEALANGKTSEKANIEKEENTEPQSNRDKSVNPFRATIFWSNTIAEIVEKTILWWKNL